jgi:group II intron reverse transcriptase/maturase
MLEPPTIRHVLDRVNLERAWQQVRANRGAPGVDEVSVTRWKRNWQANLDRLSRQVRTNTYKPNRPRRFRVLKRGGGEREISIFTVSDRVLQRAAHNVLDPVFERDFLAGSYGYRPERSVAHALQHVLQARDRGLTHVLDADIRDCFGTLRHDHILGQMKGRVQNHSLLRLIELWLRVGAARGHTGISLGAVISPLLCNIALHPLDEALEEAGLCWVRYADDFIVLTPNEAEAQRAWDVAERAVRRLGLEFNLDKTRLTTFEHGFTFLGVTFRDDIYVFFYEGKRVEVRGRNVSVLWNYIPDGYREW